jgi:hypothetical protein
VTPLRRLFVLLIAVGLILAIFVVTVYLAESLRHSRADAVALSQAVQTVGAIAGLVLAVVAALAILLRAGGVRPPELLPYGLALLGGVLLIDRHWAVPLAFAAVAVAIWLAERYRTTP